tara:strand:- start:3572 stop:3790 length:219 start_codon:yes stop_codon:yes gene_type:complete
MIEKRIEQLNHKIDAEQAEAESEKARADLQTEMKSRTQELQDKVDEAGKQLADAKNASESRLQAIADSFKNT